MEKLQINLLGPFRAEMEGQLLVGFRSDKVRALLAFLSVEHSRPWTRDFLAELFWPNYPEEKAQSNLRNSLSNLRFVIRDSKEEPPLLLISKSIIQFNTQANVFVDVNYFQELITNFNNEKIRPFGKTNNSQIELAVFLYKGSFMEGFSLDIQDFESWMLSSREQFRQKYVKALCSLSKAYTQQGDFSKALDTCNQWIDIDPWEEEAYRLNIQILTKLGRRGAALAKFETCQIRLQEDLGIKPASETIRLVQKIQDDFTKLESIDSSFSKGQTDIEKVDPGPVPEYIMGVISQNVEKSPFVARDKELAQLHIWLRDVLTNQGRTAFITGEPGIGKTFLLKEFTNQALFSHPDLLVLWGQCNAYTGQGDPYFPFINMIRMLVGDLKPLMTGTIISHEHLDRLWYLLTDTVGVMVDNGLDLINRFFPENIQFSLLEKHKGVNFDQLQSLSTMHKNKPKVKIQLEALNDQFTQVLSMISKNHPIILVIDDLQWIDPGSISMLFHLGRNLSGKKIFLIGAFRSEELNLNVENYSHPLVGILQEFQTQLGEILIDLMNSDGEEFSNALLDSEPNDFSPDFYKMLYKHTSGHPLFTIELLREMQIRREIIRNNLGKWVESRHLNWKMLPARVEAVIARRIGLLPKECQVILECASVQGEVFIVEILARILGKSENEIIDFVDQIICKRHRLISYQGEKQIGIQPFTYYRFRHALFQIYLYNHLLDHEKIRYHGLVCNHLESVFMNHLNQYPEMLHTMARHAEIGNLFEKAVDYYTLTGKNAVRLAANQEAIDHFNHALILLKTLPQSDKRDKKELELQLSLGPPLTALKGWAPAEMEKAYTRAQELCLNIDDVSQLHPAIWLLATFRLGRSEHAEVDRLVARLIEISQKYNDPDLQAMSSLQVSPLYQGKLIEAHKFLEIAGEAPDLNLQRSLTVRYGMAPAAIALGYQGNCLWLLGYPDQAVEMDIKAHELATSIDHQLSLCYVISRSCWLSVLLDKKDHLQRQSHLLSEISHHYGFKNFELAAIFFQNLLELDNTSRRKQKIEAMQYTIQTYLSTGTILNRTGFLVFFSQACLLVGEISRGLNAINESIHLGEKTGELWFQAEAWRTKGELLLAKKTNLRLETWNIKEAEFCLRNACQIASQQEAKSFELRAAMSILRLSLIQGDSLQASKDLANIYNWFTEGFNSTDLLEAKSLLI